MWMCPQAICLCCPEGFRARHIWPKAVNLPKFKNAYAAGKYVAAICAAPSVLGGLGLLDGKKATCYPGFEDKLTGAHCLTDNVVTDKNIITSRGMGTAIEFSARLIALLKDEKTADELKKSIMFNY